MEHGSRSKDKHLLHLMLAGASGKQAASSLSSAAELGSWADGVPAHCAGEASPVPAAGLYVRTHLDVIAYMYGSSLQCHSQWGRKEGKACIADALTRMEFRR